MCLAVPGQVESLFEQNGLRMGRVNFDGVRKDVCLAYLPDLCVGEYVVVHVGFAISRVDEASAQETWRAFEQMERMGVAQANRRGDADRSSSAGTSPSETP